MPYKESVTIDDVLALLNELLEKDRSAIVSLIEHRVFCNKDTANHPTVQVIKKDGVEYVGMLGILNGLFGVNEHQYGVLGIEMDDSLKFVKFVRMDKLDASGDKAPVPENGPGAHGQEMERQPGTDQ
jgi:hypothetical protein